MSKKTLIIGVGNSFRGDDGFGPALAGLLKDEGHNAISHDGEPASLIDRWQGHDHVILIDAVKAGTKPGTVFHYDLSQTCLPEEFSQTSTHAFGVAEAVELARVLKKLPEKIEFFGIEGKNFDTSERLSSEIEATFDAVKKRIQQSLKEKNHA